MQRKGTFSKLVDILIMWVTANFVHVHKLFYSCNCAWKMLISEDAQFIVFLEQVYKVKRPSHKEQEQASPGHIIPIRVSLVFLAWLCGLAQLVWTDYHGLRSASCQSSTCRSWEGCDPIHTPRHLQP